jgi:hypothetical protein
MLAKPDKRTMLIMTVNWQRLTRPRVSLSHCWAVIVLIAAGDGSAWAINFSWGASRSRDVSERGRVRCVR